MSRKHVFIYKCTTGRAYGGPEEGGWYYDTYTMVGKPVRVPYSHRGSAKKAMERRVKRMDTIFEYGIHRSEIDVYISDKMPKQYDNNYQPYC